MLFDNRRDHLEQHVGWPFGSSVIQELQPAERIQLRNESFITPLDVCKPQHQLKWVHHYDQIKVPPKRPKCRFRRHLDLQNNPAKERLKRAIIQIELQQINIWHQGEVRLPIDDSKSSEQDRTMDQCWIQKEMEPIDSWLDLHLHCYKPGQTWSKDW